MPLPPETNLEQVVFKIREAYTNPSVGKISQVVLKEGPQAFRIATLMEIIDPTSMEFHHYSLKLDQIQLQKRKGWFSKPEKSIRLEGGSPDEIARLVSFLNAAERGEFRDSVGDLRVVKSEDYLKLESLLGSLSNLAQSDKLQLISAVLGAVGERAEVSEFVAAFETSPREALSRVAIAARYIDYRDALNELIRLVSNPSTPEKAFQQHLAANPWMFGSEYSELMSRRVWTRDDSLDYMLRRTVDDYLEIVEIKTAFTEKLFIHDISHDSYYPSAKLSPVIGQVIRYVEEIERSRDTILAKDGLDTLKIKAKIVIGRDSDVSQVAALRKLNAHLHGIEILTFDQLIRIARRVLLVFGVLDEAVQELTEDDVSF